MRQPSFPLAEAAGWFLTDKAADVEPTTLRTYRIWIAAFIANTTGSTESDRTRPDGAAEQDSAPTLADLTVENAQRFCRDSTAGSTKANKIITLRSFARYLADTRVWYEHDGLSVLRDLKVPQPSPYGVPPYSDHEVRQILRAANDGDERIRSAAIVAVLLHGLRAKEARMLELRNVVLPVFHESGHLRIEYGGSKARTRGGREIPLELRTVEPVRDYIRLTRPRYTGPGKATEILREPLFLTRTGTAITRDGWNGMIRRLGQRIRRETGIRFIEHRLRSTSVRMKREAGWPDSAIIQVHGWHPETGQRMLRRYGGDISTAQLKRLPSTLDAVMGGTR